MSSRRDDLKSLLASALPPGSARRRAARVGRQVARDGRHYAGRLTSLWRVAAQPTPADPDYAAWLAGQRLSPAGVADIATIVALGPELLPLRVILVDRGDPEALERTLGSLRMQASVRYDLSVVSATEPGAVARAALAGPAAGMVAVLGAGDLVEADWVHRVTAIAHDDPAVDLIGWDDDLLVGDGLVDPRFRPGFAPDTLLGANYLGRSFALRRRVLTAERGLPDGSAIDDDVAWWSLLLALDLDVARVARLPRVLAHLPARPTASPERRRALVERHLASVLEPGWGTATVSDTPDGVWVRWEPAVWPTVSIVVPTRHNRPMLERLLPSLATTDYPGTFDVAIVDNGGRTAENEAWYAAMSARVGEAVPLSVSWWDEPFNYSAVNNVTAAGTSGEVLLFLNDDTEVLDPAWLAEMVGWAMRPDIGLVGMQLLAADGTIQHGGVVMGMHGFADHLFEGGLPMTETLIGPTWWYRDSLSVTAACVAVRRNTFEALGGFDERFVLCGSDVVLGLDAHDSGLRNVVVPRNGMAHLESATRGRSVPNGDYHASWWRYQRHIRGGDPYFSPCLSLRNRIPTLRDPHEAGPLVTVGEVLDRSFAVFRQRNDAAEMAHLADTCRATDATYAGVVDLHAASVGRHEVRTINWHVPDIDSPFYGGINTALRIADTLRRQHGVTSRFIVTAAPNEAFFRSALAAAFPALADAELVFIDGSPGSVRGLPKADIAIATLWTTAYQVAATDVVDRKFYLIQDFEPMFYPAGTNYALCEEGYRLGLYGLCNTHRLRDLYATRYGGQGWSFMPAVDDSVFHARRRRPIDHEDIATVFVYARPGHWRNCWELAEPALMEVKRRLGDRVRIVTAGSWANPDDLGKGIRHLGLLDYAQTGELYRQCDVGVALTVSEHPSYLPLELMACGVPVVAFDNPAGDWILHHDVNSLRARRTIDGLADAITALAADGGLRARLSAGALDTIAAGFSNWDGAFAGIHDYLCDPEAAIEALGPPTEAPR